MTVVYSIIVLEICYEYTTKESMNNNCIFCKIVADQAPCDKVMETPECIVIKDIAPKAAIHYLIIPKKHMMDIQDMGPGDVGLGAQFLTIAKKLATTSPEAAAFRLVVNNGHEAGQRVFHLHVHFLAGIGLSSF